MSPLNQALFWYKDEATYLRFREIFENDAQLSLPYSQWVAVVNKQIDEIAKRGIILVKIEADPNEFVAWCNINAYPPNQRARTVFAAVKLRDKFGHG